jgi:small-conductance mechanosensitive channel
MPRRLLPPSPPAFLLALFLALAAVAPASAQTPSLERARQQLERIGTTLDERKDDASLQASRDAVLEIQGQAEKTIAERTPQLQSLDARLAELGDNPATKGQEAPEVTRERRDLQRQRADTDADLRQAKLTSVEAGQLLERIAAQRQETFRRTLFERTTPPWSPRFWRDLAEHRDRDAARIGRLWADTRATVTQRWQSRPLRSLSYLALALAVAVVVGWFGTRTVPRLVGRHIPPGRLRRSAPAVARVLLSTLAAAWIVGLVHAALLPATPPADVRQLASQTGLLLVFGTFVASLGTVLLAARSPSWRLPSLSDATVAALRPLPLATALAIVLATFTEQLAALVNASLPLAVALTALAALVSTAVLLWALLRIERLQRKVAREQAESAATGAAAGKPPFSAWMNLATSIAWVGVSICLLGLLTGYIALAGFVALQLLWTGVVLAALYLGMRFIDDLVYAVLGAKGLAGRRINRRFGLDPRLAERMAVLISAVLRLLLALLGVIALAMPFGASGDDLIDRALGLARGITIGQLVLSPASVVRAVAVFLLASGAFHLLKRWLARRYLPTTRMDEGMRASVVSLFGYASMVVAVAMALAAIGVGLERIAWIASALSVGIGFGLQAIVQNFISGLILLAERPVKVGDWVVVGDAEGDIRRINVRATEIQTGDRTTVLVPNSELVTKTVRNRTFSNAEGLVKIVLPMPLATNADLVRELLLEAFREHPGILDAPAPGVLIDAITDKGQVLFNATGFVATPRQAANVRSALLFEILRRLRQLDIKMV